MILGLTAIGTPGFASDSLVQVFAGCVGRLSAQVEHEWVMQDTRAETTEQVRSNSEAVLQALLTSPDAAQQALNWRIDAKHAQAQLLTRATFNENAEDATWAKRRAKDEIAKCANLLLS